MTWVVIFRAKARRLDAEYSAMATRLRAAALSEFGCLAFHSLTEGDEEVALSYWPDEDSIRRWRAHAEHAEAQRLGQERWYAHYRVEIAEIRRTYDRVCPEGESPAGPQ